MAPDEVPAFGELLRRFRVTAGLTQEQLAERSGISLRAVGDLERDRERVPHKDTLDLLAAALNLSPQQRADLLATRRRTREARTPDTRSVAHDARPMALTLSRNALLGRESELALAGARLRRSDVRLLTLIGTGGVGKTRLALALAQELAGEFADGVHVVSLAALADPLLIPATIARSLGVSLAGRTPASERIANYLRDKQSLLVLDNCEHLLIACAQLVAELLSAAPSLKVLATSRVPLGLTIEHEQPVPSLALPSPCEHDTPASLRASPAVALFLARAEAVLPDFQPSDSELSIIADICGRLDGIPLAIELAAARVRLLTPAALLARLEKPLSLLIGGPIDLPNRQKTLRRTIDWSYALLTPAEQALFACFSVFAGGATLDAVEAVNGALDVGPDETLVALEGLVRAGLVRREEDVAGESRFSMLETIREYASERLAASGEWETVRQAHATYFLGIVEQIGAYSSINQQDVRFRVSPLEAERGNLRGALSWAAGRGDSALELRLAAAHGLFWLTSGSFTEGRRWLEEALRAAPDAPIEQRAFAYSYLGRMASHQSDYRTAERALAESLALFRQAGDARQTAWALHGLGRVLLVQGDRQRGIQLLEESLSLSEGQDLSWSNTRGQVLEILGAELVNRGEREAATRGERLLEQALALGRAGQFMTTQGLSLVALSWAAHYAGDDRRAGALLDEALAIWRTARPHVLGVHVRLSLGWLALLDGQIEKAASFFHEGLSDSAEVENWARVVDGLRGLAGVASANGSHEQAARLFGAAARLRETAGWQGYPSDPAYQQILEEARTCCDATMWADSWSAGEHLTPEAAITEALAVGA
jgi:predicted ATPase/DNA-binding XRE family transcriptional regulator